MKPTYKEIERQLAESRREFWAADATINNLELKLADMAEQLANAEEKCASMAAENEAINFYLRNGPVIRKGGEIVAAHQFSPETPATDALLAEIERKAISKFINSIEHILRDKLSAYDTEEMLEAMRIFLEEQGAKQ